VEFALTPSGSLLVLGVDDDLARRAAAARHPALGLVATNGQMYWTEGSWWAEFTDREAERPLLFRGPAACRRRCAALNAGGWPREWAPAVWAHADLGHAALEKYLRMTGVRFPGSPRR
jgi:hypothetical protein